MTRLGDLLREINDWEIAISQVGDDPSITYLTNFIKQCSWIQVWDYALDRGTVGTTMPSLCSSCFLLRCMETGGVLFPAAGHLFGSPDTTLTWLCVWLFVSGIITPHYVHACNCDECPMEQCNVCSRVMAYWIMPYSLGSSHASDTGTLKSYSF